MLLIKNQIRNMTPGIIGALFLTALSWGSDDIDPTSNEALNREQRFLDKIEARVKEVAVEKTAPPVVGHSPSESQPMPSPVEPVQNLSFVEPSKQLPYIEQATQNDKKAERRSMKKNEKKIAQEALKKDSHSRDRPTHSKKQAFLGTYVGIAGGIMHPYVDAKLCGRIYNPIRPTQKKIDSLSRVVASGMQSIYYGSYANNQNKWLMSALAFCGYDFPVTTKFRLGLEVQGFLGGGELEISSNGTYAKRYPGFLNSDAMDKEFGKPYPAEFTFQHKPYTEVDFSYTRPTVSMPYALSILPRFGLALSNKALLYTTVGMTYGLIEIMDCPETIDVKPNEWHKVEKDILHEKSHAAIVGGIGLETILTKQMFLRMECLYSYQSGIDLDLPDPDKSSLAKDQNRQLTALNIKSIKNFRFGLGAGVRF